MFDFFYQVINKVWITEEVKLQQISALVIALQVGEVGRETRKAGDLFLHFMMLTLFSFRMTTVHRGQVGQ